MPIILTRLQNCGLTFAMALVSIAGIAEADQTISDDLIVYGNACVGTDCTLNLNFGNDRLVLRQQVVRLLFHDASTATGYPSNDWRLLINDSVQNGANHFSIQDVTGVRIPFTIEAGARTRALYIESDGDIGIGTNNPVRDLHVKSGNTPGLRLEQDGSSGFAPRTWDLAGNNANFFIQDVTAGTTPFKIFPGAPNAAMVIEGTTGNLGLGTSNPEAALHIIRTDGTARVHVQEGSTTQAVRELLLMENFGGSYFTLKNTQSGRDWFFTHENAAGGRFIITSSTNPSQGLFLEPDGDMQIGGVLTQNSDKNAKMAIEPVDPGEILAKLATLPVSAWTYIDDTSGARHVGPMAQDFHALFGLGATETGISTLDTSGVALAAIQALAAENTALTAKDAAQSMLIAELKRRDAELAALAEALAAQNAEFSARLEDLEMALN